MKTIILILGLQLFVQDMFCNDSILSKLHQNGFKLRDVRIELMSCNKKYFNFCELKTFKYNRTTPATNATFNMKIAVKDKMEVLVQVRKFLSNEYRHFPIRFQVNLKKAFESNAIGLRNVKNCGNITTFIFEKDVTYHGCNFVVDETQFPPLIPNGRFEIELHMLYLNEEIAFVCIFAEVYIPIEYPKN